MIDDDPDPPQDEPENAGAADDAADPKAIKKRTVSLKQKQQIARGWWHHAFSTEVGRRELYSLLRDSHAFDERFACGPNGFPQPEATWFEAGKQAFGLALYHFWLSVDRDGVNAMLDENDPRFAVNKKR